LRRIPAGIFGTNVEWIWDGNGLWNAAAKGLDPSLVALTRDLGVTGIRFPGGIFADFYHWKDGIGPQDRRPVRMSMPGGTKSENAFGIDEAIELSKRTGAPLIMTVNIVTGTPAEAVDLLRYVKTHAVATGAPKVTDWELGNEQYVHDGSPHAREAGMTPEHYADVWLEFAAALKKEDSSIRLGAIADENYSTIVPGYRGWTETVLKKIGGRMDFLSVHNAYAPAVIDAKGLSVREIYEAMFAAPLEIATALDNTADKIERFGGNGSDRIGIAVTEWGPFFHLLPSSPFVDHVKTLGSAIYVASALRAFIASPRVQSADFFKLNDKLFMGWIGERNGGWTPKAPYYAFQMFRRHFGTRLIGSSTDSPSYSSHTVGWTAGMPQVPYVETLASRSEDGRTLFVMAINKNIDSTIPLQITLRNAKASGKATVWTMSGRSLDANTGTQLPEEGGIHWARQAEDEKNPRFDKGGPGEIRIESAPLAAAGNVISVPLPRLSVVSLEIPVQ
jgi:alpha-N-arabinofuranosidase